MSDTGPHPAPPHAQGATATLLAKPRWRAMRKELLILRADVERAELLGAVAEVRQTLSPLGWLRMLVPGLAGLRGASGKTGGVVGQLLKDYPLLSSLVSLLLARPLGGAIAKKAQPVLKWASLGFAAWKAWKVWQTQRRERRASNAAAASAPPSSESGR